MSNGMISAQSRSFSGDQIEKSPNAEVVLTQFETPDEIPRTGTADFSGSVEFVEELDIEDVSPFISVWRTRDEAVNTLSSDVTNTDGFVRFPDGSEDTPIPGSFSFSITADKFPEWAYDRGSVWVAIHGWNLLNDPAFGAVEVPVAQPTGEPEPVLDRISVQQEQPVPSGSTVDVDFSLRNRGVVDGTNLNLSLEVVDAGNKMTFDSFNKTLDQLAAGETATVTFADVPVPRLEDLSRAEFLLRGRVDGGPIERRYVDVEIGAGQGDLEVVPGTIRIAELDKTREGDAITGEPKIIGATVEWDIRNNTRFAFTTTAEVRALDPNGNVMDVDKEARTVSGGQTMAFSSNLDFDGKIGSFDARIVSPITTDRVSSDPDISEINVAEVQLPSSAEPGSSLDVDVVLEAVGNTSSDFKVRVKVEGEDRGTHTFTDVSPGRVTKTLSVTAPQNLGGATICVEGVGQQ